jgi:hypothetical protein
VTSRTTSRNLIASTSRAASVVHLSTFVLKVGKRSFGDTPIQMAVRRKTVPQRIWDEVEPFIYHGVGVAAVIIISEGISYLLRLVSREAARCDDIGPGEVMPAVCLNLMILHWLDVVAISLGAVRTGIGLLLRAVRHIRDELLEGRPPKKRRRKRLTKSATPTNLGDKLAHIVSSSVAGTRIAPVLLLYGIIPLTLVPLIPPILSVAVFGSHDVSDVTIALMLSAIAMICLYGMEWLARRGD